MPYTYIDRIRAFVVLIFFHYIGYITFRVLEYFEYPRLTRIVYGLGILWDFSTFSFSKTCIRNHSSDKIMTRQSVENVPAPPPVPVAPPNLIIGPSNSYPSPHLIGDIKAEIKKEGGGEAGKEPPAELFKEKTKPLVKLIRQRYLKNSFFFFVGVFCAILGGSKDYCIIISYLILVTKTGEIIGMFFGMLWAAYAASALGEIINCVNIITAIVYFAQEPNKQII